MRVFRLALFLFLAGAVVCRAQDTSYRVVTAIRASTLQKEMQDAADAGFKFSAVSGDRTLSGGKKVVVVMHKESSSTKREYRVISTTNPLSVKDLQQASDAGFIYLAQTVFTGPLHSRKVAVLLERDPSVYPTRYEYRLLVTKKISTMQQELQNTRNDGYELAGLTVGSTAIGMNDIVAVLRKVRTE